MNKKYILGFSLLAIAMLSCSEDKGLEYDDNEIYFNVSYPGAETRVNGSSFENGDVMGVYITENNYPLQASGNFLTNARSLYNGSNWQCVPAAYWGEGKYDVYAYYPYAQPESVDEYKFKVELDQEDNTSYTKSDFLWACTKGVSKMDAVPLSFSHVLSRLVVKMVPGYDYEGSIPENMKVVIHNTVPVGHIDLSTGIVTKDSRSSEESIVAQKESTGVYSAILIPQRIESHRPLIEIITNGVSYLVESSFIFRQGVQHTITVTLDNNPEQVKIEVGGEIKNWD